jgi:hypothetical protein
MSNIVKIDNVRIYYGITTPEALQAIFDCKQILDDNNIPYGNLIYNEVSAYPEIFANLSTWAFGTDFTQYTFTDFPIVTWQEFYDDFEVCDQVAISVEMLEASNLILLKELVV